jgi:hypothetical protein
MDADQGGDRGVTGSPAQQATLRLSPLAPPGKPGAAREPGRALRGVADRLLAVACAMLARQAPFDPGYRRAREAA